MKQFLLLLLLLDITTTPKAQQPLAIGDQMPDWTFIPIVNASAPTTLYQPKNKPLMIVFWISSCSGCLNMLSKTDALHKKFRDQFKSVFVDDDAQPEKAIALMNRREDLKKLGIPLMKRDTVFAKLFPHDGDPHIILVGKDCRIKAVTGSDYINEKVIADLIQEKEINLPLQQPTLSYANENSLFNDGFLAPDNLLFNSVLTGYIDGLRTGFTAKNLTGGRARLSIANATILNLYLTAYSQELHTNPVAIENSVVVNATHKHRFGIDLQNASEKDYKYCYELILPRKGNKSNQFLIDYMKQDLDRYFNVTAAIEQRTVKCYRIIPVSAKPSLMKSIQDQYVQKWTDSIDLHNQQLPSINATANDLLPGSMFLLNSDDTGSYSLVLKSHYGELQQLKKDLQTQGFDLVTERKQINFLVLNEN